MASEITIEDVVASVRNTKGRQKRCALLIGAGCSVTAGIPLASEFVEEIRKRHPAAYNRAEQKTYAHCMAQLAPGERRDLIGTYLDKMRINWAHIAIAQLMACGYVDRVLTTNFDSLLPRACSLIGEFPATYDLAASTLFRSHQIPEKAAYYLHGQYPGFVQLHTKSEFANHEKRLKPVFEEVGPGRVWIVVGYSGESDPVFEQLAAMEQFDYKLFWIGFKDSEPPQHVRERLLQDPKYAYHLKGFTADDFFVRLAQRLECFPPSFVQRPFSHLESSIDKLAPLSLEGHESGPDFLAQTNTTAPLSHGSPGTQDLN